MYSWFGYGFASSCIVLDLVYLAHNASVYNFCRNAKHIEHQRRVQECERSIGRALGSKLHS